MSLYKNGISKNCKFVWHTFFFVWQDFPRFVTKKWIEVYDQSKRNYSVNKEIRIKTSMLWSDFCHFSDAYIVVKGDITVTDPDNSIRNKS